jgi:ribonuclease D
MDLITKTQDLLSFCQEITQQDAGGFIAIDTEFMRRETFRAQLCLVQIAGSKQNTLVDPLAKDIDLSPLYDLLQDKNVVKVFHAARQDLEIFYYLTGHVPAPLFDTQVAAMVCGYGESIGYDSLVQSLLDLSIDKSSRFTDWSKRPLATHQLEYALKDVTHLRNLYEEMIEQIVKEKRTEWINEEMAILRDPSTYEIHPDESWKRLKVRSHNAKYLGRIKALAQLREELAQNNDIPRNRIMRDSTILQIAAENPKGEDDLKKIGGLPENAKKGTLAKQIIESLSSAAPLKSESSEKHKKNFSADAQVVELLKLWLRYISIEKGVAAKLIASSHDLNAIAAGYVDNVKAMQGWRRDIFGDTALSIAKGEFAIKADKHKLVLVKA